METGAAFYRDACAECLSGNMQARTMYEIALYVYTHSKTSHAAEDHPSAEGQSKAGHVGRKVGHLFR